MKTEMKAIAASVVVIALALAAVSGVTYSWFSDTDEAVIDVSTAGVQYDTTFMWNSKAATEYVGFPADGLRLTSIQACDEFGVKVSMVNKSTIDTKYRIVLSFVKGAGYNFTGYDLANIGIVNGGSTQYLTPALTPIVLKNWTDVEPRGSIGDFEFGISIPETYGNSVSGSGFVLPDGTYYNNDWAPTPKSGLTFKVTVEAYQQNYTDLSPGESGTSSATVPASGLVDGEVEVDGVGPVGMTVALPADCAGRTFSASIAKSDDRYTISATIDNGTVTAFASPVAMTVVLPGNLAGSNVVYLGTTGEQPEVVSAVYDGSANTTITFTTTHFSDFAVVAGDIVAIADTDNGVTTFTDIVEAFAQVSNNGKIVLLKDSAGNGVVVPSGKEFTVDFQGHTYNIDGTTVGSSGTETNGFQLLMDSTLTFKNGTIVSSKAIILIQNYCNLTLDNMVLDGKATNKYVLSNNNGTTTINSTRITAASGKVAFDVYGNFGSYAGPSVTVTGDSVIEGEIEFDVDEKKNNNAKIQSLSLESGDFTKSKLSIKGHMSFAQITKANSVTIETAGGIWNGNSIEFSTEF